MFASIELSLVDCAPALVSNAVMFVVAVPIFASTPNVYGNVCTPG